MALNNTSIDVCLLTKTLQQQTQYEGANINIKVIIALDITPTLITIIANALLIVTILKTSSLQTPSNILVGALCMSDFLVGIFAQPLFIMLLVYAQAGLDFRSLVHIFWYSGRILGAMSFTYMLYVTLDRYYAICHPFKYQRFVTCKRLIYLLVGTTIVTIALPFLNMEIFFWVCMPITISAVPIMLFCYGSIYYAIRKQRRIVARIVSIGEEERKEIRKTKENRSTAFTLVIIFVVFMLCYFPMLIAVATKKGLSNLCTFSVELFVYYTWAELLLFLNSFINPIIYCLRMKAMRHAARNIFCKKQNAVFNG